jgi:hypothetical protein
MKIEPRDMIGERAENLKNFQPTGDRQKDKVLILPKNE